MKLSIKSLPAMALAMALAPLAAQAQAHQAQAPAQVQASAQTANGGYQTVVQSGWVRQMYAESVGG
jgi:hypothetical protein